MLNWISSIVNGLFGVKRDDVLSNSVPTTTELLRLNPVINFLINDPTTPATIKRMEIPPDITTLLYSIKGFNRRTPSSNPQAVHCHITLVIAINAFQKILAAAKKQPVKRWAATTKLAVFPLAGVDFNAYYDRTSLRYFYDTDPITKQKVYAANSTDVISHEIGHAFLDLMRKDFWNIQAPEVWAFHEAFADINAMITVMQFDEILQSAINETSGDISKSNIITRLAEEMGSALYHLTGGKSGYNPNFLRSAVNDFKYVDPKTLPSNGTYAILTNESHNFSRIFVGTWWDIVSGIYKKEQLIAHASPLDAFKTARDVAHQYLIEGVLRAPLVLRCYDAIVRSILIVDGLNNSRYKDVLQTVFQNRQVLLARPITVQSEPIHYNDIKFKFSSNQISINDDSISVVMPKTKTVKLGKEKDVAGISLMAAGVDLSNVELEVPADEYYEFERNGMLRVQAIPSEDDLIEAARACVDKIIRLDHVGDEERHMWKVESNKLIRRHIT